LIILENKIELAVYQQQKIGEIFCGDSYYYDSFDEQFICVIVDGLGSGREAAKASQMAIQTIKEHKELQTKQIVKIISQKMAGQRGVVLGILRLDFANQRYSFESIGNIGLLITCDQQKKRTLPNAGYLAGYYPNLHVSKGVLDKSMNFILFSDGVRDEELANHVFYHHDVHSIIATFNQIHGQDRIDDTTLIAIHYHH